MYRIKVLIEYSNDMDDIYKNIEEHNPNKKRKILVVFDDMIADMLSNKKVNPTVTDLFIRGRKWNISLAFTKQYYFAVPKNIRLNSTHYFVIKFQTKDKFSKLHSIIHQILTFKTLWVFKKKCTKKAYSFLVIDITLASGNYSHFRKNL